MTAIDVAYESHGPAHLATVVLTGSLGTTTQVESRTSAFAGHHGRLGRCRAAVRAGDTRQDIEKDRRFQRKPSVSRLEYVFQAEPAGLGRSRACPLGDPWPVNGGEPLRGVAGVVPDGDQPGEDPSGSGV